MTRLVFRTFRAIPVVCLALVSCKGRSADHDSPPVASTAPSAVPLSSAPPSAPSVASAVPSAAAPQAAASNGAKLPDAGASACRLLQGPLAQPLRGAALLAATAQGVDLVFNEEGRPKVLSFPAGPIDPAAKPIPTSVEGTSPAATFPPCAVGGRFVYCADKAGEVHRTPRGGGAATLMANSRPLTRIDAATLGDHAIFTYLASRKTSEGFVSEAWLGVDEAPPVRLSEEGSGATSVALAPRGNHVIAAMLDARAALTPVHAREISEKAVIGGDAVIFVGGPPERHTAFALATPADGPAFVLLPIAKDTSTFGLGSLRIDSPPVVDAPAVWSVYPNGLDPAPVAATHGRTPMWAARVRPASAEPSSPKVVEMGKVDPNGVFVSAATIPTHGNASDLALETDRFGAVWIYYSDPAGGWVERRACP